MNGRIFTIPFVAVVVTAVQDLWEITTGSSRPLLVHSIEIEQETEVGDAAEEGLRIVVRRGTAGTTSGSGGTAVTPRPKWSTDVAAAFVAEVNNTTVMSAGTITDLRGWAWNVRVPFFKCFTPETQLGVIGTGERLTVALPVAPADAITMNGTLTVEEIG